MKILAIIPARYASTRFPGKPLAKILGKPMIQRVYERAKSVFSDVWVATDDQRIEDCCHQFGANVVMTSETCRSGTDRAAEAMQKIGGQWDAVINIQGDEPFILETQLRALCSLFEDPKCEIATLVEPFKPTENIENPNSPKVVLGVGGYALYFSRSAIPFIRSVEKENWQNSHVFFKHIGLYGYRPKVLLEITKLPAGNLEKAESLEQLRWLENGYKIRCAECEGENWGIDTPEDLKRVEDLFKN